LKTTGATTLTHWKRMDGVGWDETFSRL